MAFKLPTLRRRRKPDEPRLDPARTDGGPDRLGAYPASMDAAPLEHRRNWWTAYVFATVACLSVVLNIVQGGAIITLTPLVRVVPMLVTFQDKGAQVVRIEPFERTMRGLELMTEQLAKEYILIRHTIVPDAKAMAQHWDDGGTIRRRSSDRVWKAFAANTAREWPELVKAGVSQTVEADGMTVLALGDRFYRVEFTARLFQDGQLQRTRRMAATMTVDYEEHRVDYRDRYVNPLGFTVTAYSVHEVTGE